MYALLVSLLATLPATPAIAPVCAEPVPAVLDQDPPADNREDVKAMLDQLDDLAGDRGDKDPEAIAVIDKLVHAFPESGPKDRSAIVKSLDKCFKEKRNEDENGVRQNQLYLAAATALGEMSPESVSVLLSWIGHKSHKKDLALQRLLILKLGKTQDEKAIKPLIKLLDDHEPQIQSAVAEALGDFDEVDLDERKDIFEELLKLLMAVKSEVDADNTDSIARNRYDAVAAPIITSLQRLSKHNEHDPQEWQRWWNRNKKADWDDLDS